MYKRNLAFSDYSILKNNLVLHNPHFTREGVFLLQLYALLINDQCSPSYRNQPMGLHCESSDWFVYDGEQWLLMGWAGKKGWGKSFPMIGTSSGRYNIILDTICISKRSRYHNSFHPFRGNVPFYFNASQLMVEIAPNMGHYPAKNFLLPAAFNAVPVIMTDCQSFAEIYFSLAVVFDCLKHLLWTNI